VFGRLADRIGRKRPLVYGLLWDAVSLALYAAAGSPLALLLVRLSQGLGGGVVGPASMALVSDRADAARKGRAFAMYGISIAVAVILGFAVAGVASARGDLRTMFFGLSFALWTGALVASRIREPAGRGPPSRVDLSAFLQFLRYRGAVGGYAAIFALYLLLGALIVLAPLEFGGRPESLGVATGGYSALLVPAVAVGAPLAGAMAAAWTPAPAFLAIAVVAVISLAFLAPAALAGRETLRSPE